MPRLPNPALLTRIVDVATMAFIRGGYRNTRIEDVAGQADVAVGTVYRYVENKAALFELVLRRAFHDPGALEPALPYRATDLAGQVEQIWRLLSASASFETLRAAAELVDEPQDVGREVEAIVRETYGWLFGHWRGLKLIERCARDWPELAALFYRQFRAELLALGTRYVQRRTAQGLIRHMPDAAVAARLMVETCAFFAMHRHTAPDSTMDDAVAEETVVRMLRNAFVEQPAGRSA